MFKKDLTGQRFTRLLVVEYRGQKKYPTYSISQWLVRCDCGTEKIVGGPSLTRGLTKSCGCWSHFKPVHGLTSHPAYQVYTDMMRRCYDPRTEKYPDWGGRGIYVCDEWNGHRETFIAWAGEHPLKGETIERRDHDGPYAPDNCCWATQKAQANNRRSSRLLTLNDKTQTMTQWAEETGIKTGTIWARLKKGWSVHDALTAPHE